MHINIHPRQLARPTPAQIEWADAEIGVIIHFDVQVFEPGYSFRHCWGYTPDVSVFNPPALDTDQWIATAKSAGARYAILVAKHCSGFSLWPTQAHDYHIGNTPWKGGRGDIVSDFVQSCRTFGLKPGIYCSLSTNAYLRVGNPGKVISGDPDFLKRYNTSLECQTGEGTIWAGPEEQERYRKIAHQQLTELWQNYGEWFEIWFDGGILTPEKGGVDLLPLLQRFQPNAVVYQGPDNWHSLARTVGNERGEAPDPFCSASGKPEASDGTEEDAGCGGHPDARQWISGEAPMPNRDQLKALQGGWFWREGDDCHLYNIDHLAECYCSSVGRNANLLLGMVIDNRGLAPEADTRQFAGLGRRIHDIFSRPVHVVSGPGRCLEMPVASGQAVNLVVLQENIAHGERIRRFVVEARTGDTWIPMFRGRCVGHKRIERFEAIQPEALRLRVLESVGEPQIREFSAWHADPALFPIPMDPAKRNPPRIHRDSDGRVHLTTANPNLDIRFTTDGSDPNASSPRYTSPIPLPDGGLVKASSFVHPPLCSDTETAIFGVDRRDWKVVSVSMDSPFECNGRSSVRHLLDDNPEGFWQTFHTDRSKSKPPQEVVLDMNRTLELEAFTLVPLMHKAFPRDIEFFLSPDGKTWKSVLRADLTNLENQQGIQLVGLPSPFSGRFLRVVIHRVMDADFVLIAGIGAVERGTIPPASNR